MNDKLAIIILNYRTPALTIDCLASIENEIDDGMLVVIVDNNSADGSCDKIAKAIAENGWSKWCRLIQSEVNGGFAAGNNIGIRAVEASFYILLNSDTIIRPGAFSSLRRALIQNPSAGLIAPGLESIEGRTEQNIFRDVKPLSEFLRSANTGPISLFLRRYIVAIPPCDSPFEPEWVGFACVAVRREVIEQVGFLDEHFFMYFEDIDYCRRARINGWKILYWPEARIIHLLGASSGVTRKSSLRRRPPKFYYEARAHYFKKYFGHLGFLIANLLWNAGRCISSVREAFGSQTSTLRHHEFFDIWTGMVRQNLTSR